MKEEYIRDFKTRRIIGIIKTDTNGDKTAVDFDTRRILGFYRKNLDHTTNFYGVVLAKGDCVVSLIYENAKK